MDAPRNVPLTAASAIFWIWGILLLVSGVAVGYPALASSGNFVPLVLMVAWGSTYCVGGFALRRKVWGVRWWSSVLCLFSVAILLVVGVKVSMLGAAVNVLALVLIVLSWRALGAASSGAGARA